MNAGTRRLTPGIVFLAIALVGSLLFVAYAVNVRDASQIPLYSIAPASGVANTASSSIVFGSRPRVIVLTPVRTQVARS